MLGRVNGCHERLKERIPTLPDLGGCLGHDGCNIIKLATKAMAPEHPNLFSCMHGNLEKHSSKKNRLFKDVNEAVGLDYHHVPKFKEVRFRYIVKLCKYMEDNDRPLYVYYSDLLEKFKLNQVQLSETEVTILRLYLGDYVNVRLTNMFILSVSKEII